MKKEHVIRWKQLTVVALLTGGLLTAGTPVRYIIQPQSQLWIEGSSNLHAWNSEAGEISGFIEIESSFFDSAVWKSLDRTPSVPGPPRVHVSIPVREIHSGHKTMDKKLHKALKADEQPVIRYYLTGARVVHLSDRVGESFQVRTRGELEVAGKTAMIDMVVTGSLKPQGQLTMRGLLPLRMTIFGIKPPRAIGGLLKTHDDIIIRFNLVAEADTNVDKLVWEIWHQWSHKL